MSQADFLILSKEMHLMSAGNGAASEGKHANLIFGASSAEALTTRNYRTYSLWINGG